MVTAQLPAQTTTTQYTSTTSDDRISNQTRDPLEISAELLAALDSASAFSTFSAEATPMPDQANFGKALPDRRYRQEVLPDIDRYSSDSLEDEIALALTTSNNSALAPLKPLADDCAMYGFSSSGFARPLYFELERYNFPDKPEIYQLPPTSVDISISEGTLEEQAEDIKILLSELIRAEPEGIAIDCPATLNVDRYNFEIAQRLRDMHEILGLEPHQSRELPRLSEKLGELLASPAENLDTRDIQGIRAAERIVSAALEAGLHPGIALRDVGYVTGRNGNLGALSALNFELQETRSWPDDLRIRIYPTAQTNKIEIRDHLVLIGMTDGDYNLMKAIFEAFPDLSTFRHLRYLDIAGQQFELIDNRLESVFDDLEVPAANRDAIARVIRREPPAAQYDLRHYDVLALDENFRTTLARGLVDYQNYIRNRNPLSILEPIVVPFLPECHFITHSNTHDEAIQNVTQVEVKLSDRYSDTEFSDRGLELYVTVTKYTTLDELIGEIQEGINHAFSAAAHKARDVDWLPEPSCELNTQGTADDIAIDVLFANRAYFQRLVEARAMVLDAVPELSRRFDNTGSNSSTIQERVEELNAWTIASTEYGILASIFYFIDAPLYYFIDHFYLTEPEQFNYRLPWKFDSERNTIVYPLAEKTKVRTTRNHLEIYIAHDATQAELERLTPVLQGDPDAIKVSLLANFQPPPQLVFDGRRSLLAP